MIALNGDGKVEGCTRSTCAVVKVKRQRQRPTFGKEPFNSFKLACVEQGVCKLTLQSYFLYV